MPNEITSEEAREYCAGMYDSAPAVDREIDAALDGAAQRIAELEAQVAELNAYKDKDWERAEALQERLTRAEESLIRAQVALGAIK